MRASFLLAASLLLLGPAARAGAGGGKPAPATLAGPDSAEVGRFLAGLGASDPLVCALATDIIGTGVMWHSGDEGIAVLGDAPAEAATTRERFRRPITEPGALRLLAPGLQSPNPCIRRTAAALLGESERPEARAALRAGLARGDERVREAATYGLGVAGDSADLPRLRALLVDHDADVVRLAAWALGSMEDRPAEPALVGLLRHPDARVRRSAAWALGRL